MKHEIYCTCWRQHEKRDTHLPHCLLGTYDDEKQVWNITLNKYHRDNLLWLFNAIGWPEWDKAVPPFNLANTGDWNGEIPQMLAKPGQDWLVKLDPPFDYSKPGMLADTLKYDQPNVSIEQLRQSVEAWLERKKKGE